ncbi:MAG: STAS domain-containing protein, partial [Calditrichia bacterium]|nr:STAS domain-containing protein [Calditrichia bacterium]
MKENISVVTKFADPDGRVMIVNLKGYVDQGNSDKLQKVLDDIATSGCYHVVFDFTELYYISSAGWGIFVGEIRRFRENGGDIKITRMSPEVSQVFQMLEFFHIIEEYPTMDEALE